MRDRAVVKFSYYIIVVGRETDGVRLPKQVAISQLVNRLLSCRCSLVL